MTSPSHYRPFSRWLLGPWHTDSPQSAFGIRVRILSAFSLALFVIAMGVIAVRWFWFAISLTASTQWTVSVLGVLVLGCYLINRLGYYQFAALGLLTFSGIGVFVVAYGPDHISQLVPLTLLPHILVIFLFSTQKLRLIAAIHALAVTLATLLLPWLKFPDYGYMMVSMLVLDGILLLYMQFPGEFERVRTNELEQRVNERTEELAVMKAEAHAMYEAARLINGKLGYRDILGAFTQVFGQPDNDILLLVYDATGTQQLAELRIVAHLPRHEMEVRELTYLLSSQIGQRMLAQEMPISEVADLLDEPALAFVAARGLKGLYPLPVVSERRRLGYIVLLKHEEAPLTDLQKRIFRGMSDLAAGAIERTQLVNALEDALLKAHEADQIKLQFLASMSHELRTPLNAIITFNQLMALGTFGDVTDEQVENLKKVLRSSRHLLALINDILDISKIQSGMLTLFIEADFHLPTELMEIVEQVRPQVDGERVDLRTEIDTDLPMLTCDKRRIRQVLLNLLSNAIKFTSEGWIKVSASRIDDRVLISVQDTGAGIPGEKHDVIFQPFMQTDEGIVHAGGTGLGLPISRSIVESHHGRLWVESEPGKGATFHVSLPLNSQLKPG